jgi:hypothetical protein
VTLLLLIVRLLELNRWNVTDRLEQAMIVEPIDPLALNIACTATNGDC